MVTIWDVEAWVWITAWVLTIADVIKNWIFECMEKNSPMVKDLKKSISEIVDQRYKESNKELKLKLHNYLWDFWDTEDLEEEILWLWDDENIFPKEIWKLFERSKDKAEWLLYLMKKQVEWYAKWLKLRSEIEKQKESLISQFSLDIDKFIDSMDFEIKDFFKYLPNIEENSEKWKNVWIELKDFCIEKIILLIDPIIEVISVKS